MKTKRISRNTNYKRGRTFEYRVKRHFENLGYYVIRSYASKGAADLYCFKGLQNTQLGLITTLCLVQCKNYDINKRKPAKEEVEALKQLAKITGGVPVYVYNNSKHKLQIKEID